MRIKYVRVRCNPCVVNRLLAQIFPLWSNKRRREKYSYPMRGQFVNLELLSTRLPRPLPRIRDKVRQKFFAEGLTISLFRAGSTLAIRTLSSTSILNVACTTSGLSSPTPTLTNLVSIVRSDVGDRHVVDLKVSVGPQVTLVNDYGGVYSCFFGEGAKLM